MPDDPAKRGADGHTVSAQEHEIRYVVDQLRSEFPSVGADRIRQAVLAAKQAVQPSESRDRVLAEARRRLKAL